MVMEGIHAKRDTTPFHAEFTPEDAKQISIVIQNKERKCSISAITTAAHCF
jgi:hypothetical protein